MLDPGRGSGVEHEWRRRVGRAMLLGTAKLLEVDAAAAQPPEPCGETSVSGEPSPLSVVAQAESEDFQEFSPTHVRHCGSRLGLLHLFTKEATRAISHARMEEERDTLTSLPAQDGRVMTSCCDIITPPPQFKDSHDGGGADDSSQFFFWSRPSESESESDWSASAEARATCTFSSSSSSSSSSSPLLAHREFGSAPSPAGNVVWLGASATRVDVRHLLDWRENAQHNRGFLLHEKLRPVSGLYREGREYDVLRHIHSGAYGDVVCVRDCATRFTCAAKKVACLCVQVPASRFRQEEVTSWSLAASPRVLRLFGAVKEGPNVVLFMDMKPAGLAQLLGDGGLPRDLALHYLHQTLGALRHLHSRNVLHLDVKVDNVLLSADLTKCFLCDFGHSRVLDERECGAKGMMGACFPGTESHMAPEVARGERRPSAKADVWSSCCMLLHLLNGRHPWIRRFTPPLCLHIVRQPAPLWEVPSDCDRFTLKVFRGGLRKDPDRRDSAAQLKRKIAAALAAAGGVSGASLQTARAKLNASRSAPAMHWVSPWRTAAADEDHPDDEDDSLALEREGRPTSLRDQPAWDSDSDSEMEDIYVADDDGDDHRDDYEGDCEDDEDESSSSQYVRALLDVFPVLRRGQWAGSEEPQILPGVVHARSPSPEPRDDPPSCFSSSSQASQKDSADSSDDVSSGASCSGRRHAEMSAWARGPPSRRLDGVDVWIEDARGRRVRIRERRRVRVGHVAVGISEQMSASAFTLEMLDRKPVCFRREIRESCLWLRCVDAPDSCPRWTWRVRGGKLEVRQ
ncbi:mitogen-activated protein kinase kinase kinase 14-like [Festucalex cinctus]